jgi:tripartite-type tricarboxylate transporter receptor subunit TctC
MIQRVAVAAIGPTDRTPLKRRSPATQRPDRFGAATAARGPLESRHRPEKKETSVIAISRLALALAVLVAAIGPARAADYPTRPVKWVVPYPPAGTTDVLARLIAQWLTEKLGQPFVIENKPGAGNNLGTEAVVNAPPDGYTMLLVNPANGINATLYKNLNFNLIRDIAPVAGIVRTPNVMEVTPSFPAKTVAEFIAYCKANPGKINMASSGSGTSVHLSGELFKSMTGCQMLHVPYKGAGPALTDLMGGQVDVIFDNLPSSVGHIKGGKIRALGVTSQEREPSLPQLPTIAETVPGYEATAWFGIGMPKGTPKEVIEKVNAEVNRALADPKMRERLAELGGKPIAGTPEDFGKVIAAETAKWEKVVISSGAKVE